MAVYRVTLAGKVGILTSKDSDRSEDDNFEHGHAWS